MKYLKNKQESVISSAVSSVPQFTIWLGGEQLLCNTKGQEDSNYSIYTTDQNIWFRESLLAAELFEAEVEPQQYHKEIDDEGDEVIPSFNQNIQWRKRTSWN